MININIHFGQYMLQQGGCTLLVSRASDTASYPECIIMQC